jgi:hypothetical protein
VSAGGAWGKQMAASRSHGRGKRRREDATDSFGFLFTNRM